MRKYYQAALAIIASISLVAVIFYRHEYNRLRYVLEVFNYFGKPPGDNESPVNCTGVVPPTSLKYYDNYEDFDEPIPSWQRLNDEIYVYSSYRLNDGEIRSVGLAKAKRSSPIALSCDIFYENTVEPIAGKFTYRSIDSSSSSERKKESDEMKGETYRGYHFVCNYPKSESKKFIASVKFSTKSDSGSDNEASITLSVRQLEDRSTNHESNDNEVAGLCVVPFDQRPLVSRDMIDFLSFHSSIGIERFIVYDFAIAPRFNAVLKRILPIEVSKTSKLVTYTAIPWNFPFSRVSPDTIRSLVEADCLYRTYGKIGILATLKWNDYIVLKYHRSIAKLFRDIDETSYKADRYRVSTLNLCVDRLEKKNGSNDLPIEPRILVNVKNLNDNRPIYIHRRSKMSQQKTAVSIDDDVTREITPDVIVVNRYEEVCDRSGGLETVSLEDRACERRRRTPTKSA